MSDPLRTKAARRAAPKAARAGAAVFASLVRKTKYAEPSLAENWPSIAGGEIASLCRPGRITGGPTARTLEVRAPTSAAAAALQMRLDDLQARVNRYLGPGAIARIAILQSASHASRDGNDADDGRLGRALASFRAAVSGKTDGST